MYEENDWNGVVPSAPVSMVLVNVISLDEVKMEVRDTKNRKTVGPDGIPVEVLGLKIRRFKVADFILR